MRGSTTSASLLKRLAVVTALWFALSTLAALTAPAGAHYATGVKARRRHVVERALSQVGTPYRYASESPRRGFDCSGLTYWTFKSHGALLERSSLDQWRLRRKPRYKQVFRRANRRGGDLGFFKTSRAPVGHVGIYIGHGRFVHSSSSRGGVRRDSLSDRYYWRAAYVGAIRAPNLRGELDEESAYEQGSDDLQD